MLKLKLTDVTLMPQQALKEDHAVPPAESGPSDIWELYRTHRQHVTNVLLPMLDTHPRRVVVLGCGANDDLDLARIVSAADDVHLVDWDRDAIRNGVAAQLGAEPHGVSEHVVNLSAPFPSNGPFGRLADTADLVVSSCVLSQLVDHAEHTTPVSIATRRHHLDTISSLLKPGGQAMLITDVTSSVTTPELRDPNPAVGLQLLLDSAASGNVFAGVNPFAIARDIEDRVDLEFVAGFGPWAWHESADRCYLVVGIHFTKTTED